MLNKIVNHLLVFVLMVIFTAASAIFWGISFPFLVLRQLRGEEKFDYSYLKQPPFDQTSTKELEQLASSFANKVYQMGFLVLLFAVGVGFYSTRFFVGYSTLELVLYNVTCYFVSWAAVVVSTLVSLDIPKLEKVTYGFTKGDGPTHYVTKYEREEKNNDNT